MIDREGFLYKGKTPVGLDDSVEALFFLLLLFFLCKNILNEFISLIFIFLA